MNKLPSEVHRRVNGGGEECVPTDSPLLAHDSSGEAQAKELGSGWTSRAGASARESAPTHSPPQIPDYELLRCVGRGAYGEVWLARSVTGAYRAVKVIYRQDFSDERPYEREFKGIQKFEPVSRTHESQMDILHVGRNDSEGYFYYVMELADDGGAECGMRRVEGGGRSEASVEGGGRRPEGHTTDWLASYIPRTLKQELGRRGCLPAEECIDVGLALTTALEHLHQNGLVHRDVKPSNIIFVNSKPKLADIGLVTDLDATVSFVGTEGYVPPEGPGTPQADVYSLGKVLYEISTGKDRQEFPEPPTRWEGRAEEARLREFHEILLRACERDSTRRYQTAREMRADLALLQSGKSIRRVHALGRRVFAWRVCIGNERSWRKKSPRNASGIRILSRPTRTIRASMVGAGSKAWNC